MTGRQKIEKAFSSEGSDEIPVIIPYEDILIRDHWDELTSCPWWYGFSTNIDEQLCWINQVIENINQDWFNLPNFYTNEDRKTLSIDIRGENVYFVNKSTGHEELLQKPQVSGAGTSVAENIHSKNTPSTPQELDALLAYPKPDKDKISADIINSGRAELAYRMLDRYGDKLYPIRRIDSPIWRCYKLWGYEETMVLIASEPQLVQHACELFLTHCLYEVYDASAFNPAGIWIEECMSDIVNPEFFMKVNLPVLQKLTDEITATGMNSIYYFTGKPDGKMDMIIDTGADALALEESKKSFHIDICEIAKKIDGRMTLFGNLDSIGVLQNGSEEQLRDEISRQITAGRLNGNRFTMSLGSPVTPETPIDRVRLFCDIAHEAGMH